MAKIEPANLLLKDKDGNTGLVKSLTNKDITTLKGVVTNVDYIKDFVNTNGGSLPVQGDIHLTATDEEGNNSKTLLGTSNGILQWNNQNLVRSVNGVEANENGDVVLNVSSGGVNFPDYSAIVAKSVDTVYTAECDGYIEVFVQTYSKHISTNGGIYIYVYDSNNKEVLKLQNQLFVEDKRAYMSDSSMLPIPKGYKYKVQPYSVNTATIRFIPCKGV